MQKRFNWKQLVVMAPLCVMGCHATDVYIPTGHMPVAVSAADQLLPTSPPEQQKMTPPRSGQEAAPGKSIALPPGLPGSDAPPLQAPVIPNNASPAERELALQQVYPVLPAVPMKELLTGTPLTLGSLQDMASSTNPTLRKAQADADAAYGAMIQAGLYPNPVVGYQGDQNQPWASPVGNAGQQGAFISQLIKTAGKLSLAQQVAGYDYLNALVAARKAQVDVITQIRTAYFALLVAQQSVEVNRSLVTLADEAYRLQRKQVQAGEAAGYEPLQLYAQALQARTQLAQAEAAVRTAWKQLVCTIGQPTLAMQPISGRADGVAPTYADDTLRKLMLDQHTDLLAARNKQLQSQANLSYQQAVPIPDVQTNVIVQYDNVVKTTQFGVQLGVSLPLFDRNQGNIRQAQAQIASTGDAVVVTENDLQARLTEALNRYEASKVTVSSYRELILPNLARAYQAMLKRYQLEPEKVTFNDIVVAQQNLAQSLQVYLNSMDVQWKAVVDLASLGQLNDLFEPSVMK